MAFRFVPNPNMLAELAAGEEFKAFTEKAAEAAAEAAQELAPGEEGEHYFADGSKLASDSSTWHIIEYGSVNNLPYSTMRRAIKAVGMELVELSQSQAST